MSTVQPNYLFLNTIQASGADVSVSEGILKIGRASTGNITPGMKIKNIQNVYQKTAAAAVNQVVTVTVPTPVVGDNYAFQLTQQNASGEYVSYYVSFEATTTTVADVHAGLKSVASALATSGALVATVAGTSPTITITGTSANPIVFGEAIEGITSVVVTPGNEASGLGSDLIAAGITGISEQPVAATLYSLFLINYYNEAEPLNAQGRTVQAQTYVYYNSTASTELTAFEADLLAKVYTITSAANAGAAVSVEKI
jgi:hypothetical protein